VTSALAAGQQEPELYNLSEIIVTSGDQATEKVATVMTVTAATIESRGVRTLDQASQLVPGINIRVGADGTPRIDIRGMRTRHVLFLLNGIPMNSTYDGQFDPRTIPTEMIAEIKVTTGGGSVLYGDGGNGGVINIITKHGQQGLSGAFNAEVAQEQSYLNRLTLSAGGDRYNAFVSASRADRDGTPLSNHYSTTAAEDGDDRDNSDLEQTDLFTNIDYALSDRTQIGVSVNYQQGEYGKPAISNYDKKDIYTKSPKYLRVDDSEGVATQLAFSHQTEGLFSIRGWGFYNELQLEENRYDDDSYASQVEKGAYSSDSTTKTTGGTVQINADLQQAGGLTLALMGRNEDWSDSGFEVDKNGDAIRYSEDEDVQLYTTALEYEVNLLDNLGMVLGYGYHWQNRNEGNDADTYSYLIGLYYDVAPSSRIKLSHARKIRFPSIKQLYGSGGDADLVAEETLHYELGLEQQLPANTLLSINGFVNDASNFIEKDDEDINQNNDEYLFHGFEVALDNRHFDNLLLSLSYSYLESEDRSATSEKHQLQNRPRDRVTFETLYGFAWGMKVQASVMYVANQYFYDADGKDELEQKRASAYTVVDVKVSQALLNDALELYIGANNLFDEDYEQSYGYPQPGRNVYGGVSYRF
jgi:outer membrane cobalamin receptor